LGKPGTPAVSVDQATVMAKSAGTVLLVDDEDTVRRVAEKILTGSGYRVVAASDGEEGVAAFRFAPARFDVVLLDLTMPRVGGEEALRRLQEIRPDVRVLIMSGFSEQDTANRFLGRGVAGFLAKPFNAEMLLTKVGKVLAARSS
jgi:DNA-binding NtrC family response regulator